MRFLSNNLPEDDERIVRELIEPTGKVVREVRLPNPYTGEILCIMEIETTRYNPQTDSPEIVEQEMPIVGIDGEPIFDPYDFSVCAVTGMPVSRRNSVIDPFCGRVVCLPASQMIEFNGMCLRVCADCAKAIKRARRWEAIKNFLLGR